MDIPKIAYTPNDADRHFISGLFSCPLADVPANLTAGEVTDDRARVLFAEMLGGYRIGLPLEGRADLVSAAAAAILALDARASVL